jgi:hypothetical protein
MLRDFAEFKATCPDASFRNGKQAVELAQQAIQVAGSKADWKYQAALAAAHAEVGNFTDATAEQKKALDDKTLAGMERSRMEARLKLYEQKKPCRE